LTRPTPTPSSQGDAAGVVVAEDLNIFEADSASFLKQVLANFGINLYCPVSSIGDALPVPTFRG
jgi:hypothetical protein